MKEYEIYRGKLLGRGNGPEHALSLRWRAMKRFWTPAELALLTANYANSRTDDLAAALNRTLTTVYQKAIALGLRKTAEYLATQDGGRVQRGKKHDAMKGTQFKPGQAAWNKGTKGIVGVQEACRATQFKKGRPATEARNYLPIGTQRITREGILEQKMTDDLSMDPHRRWVGVQRLVWEAAHGPIPAGHVVVFKAGRKTTEAQRITLDALEMLTRDQLMKRNSVHNMPKELALLVQLRGAVNRQINARKKS